MVAVWCLGLLSFFLFYWYYSLLGFGCDNVICLGVLGCLSGFVFDLVWVLCLVLVGSVFGWGWWFGWVWCFLVVWVVLFVLLGFVVKGFVDWLFVFWVDCCFALLGWVVGRVLIWMMGLFYLLLCGGVGFGIWFVDKVG